MTKSLKPYTSSLHVKFNTTINSLQASSINNYYVDILSKFNRKLSMQTGLIVSSQPWSIERELATITFDDISCLNKVTYDVYGAWDEEGFITLNGITFALPHCNWWLPHPSWIGTDQVGDPYIYYDKWGSHYLGHRDYNFFNFSKSFSKTDIQKIVKNSKDNQQITCKSGIRDIGNLDPSEFGGGADGYIDFTFNFISKRH